jgi:DNA-binding response OmpR family regulator
VKNIKSKDNIEISLPRKEFELFYLFQARKVFKRDEILDKVWGSSSRRENDRCTY